MSRQYSVVDAFTGTPFHGNPAAVVLDAEGLADERMQAIATEFNLSETTFVLPAADLPPGSASGDAVRFRWFTPACEVGMCGHATIAGLHALVESNRIPAPEHAEVNTVVAIDTRGGRLTGFVERLPGAEGHRMIWIELVPPRLENRPVQHEELARVLRVPPDVFDESRASRRTQDHDLIVFVRDLIALNYVRPDFQALTKWMDDCDLRGLSLATTETVTPSVHVQSRYFAPNCGINEDPVTGSVHGPLAACLASEGIGAEQDGLTALSCLQGIPGGRAGQLYAIVGRAGDGSAWVRIGGQAVTTMRGELL